MGLVVRVVEVVFVCEGHGGCGCRGGGWVAADWWGEGCGGGLLWELLLLELGVEELRLELGLALGSVEVLLWELLLLLLQLLSLLVVKVLIRVDCGILRLGLRRRSERDRPSPVERLLLRISREESR